jgi:peroxiredoxin
MKTTLQSLVILAVVILLSACNQEPSFSLKGTTQDFEDGTKLYIRAGQEVIDSTKIVNNQFEFHTQFESLPIQVVLGTKRNKHYRVLWLENSAMNFDASKASNFKKAVVTGSESELLSQQLFELKKGVSLRKEKIQIEQNFIKEHPSQVFAANVLGIYASTWGKEKTQELYNTFSTEVKSSSYGKDVKRYIDLAIEPKIGDRYADFTIKDVHGNQVSLSDYEGKLVLLEFWSSWCGGCRAENPNLVKTYEKYRSKGFEVLGVSLDEIKESWLKAIEKDRLPWTQVSDLSGPRNSEPAIKYGVTGMPDNFLIDQNGVIVARQIHGEELQKKLDKYLVP